MQSNFLTRVETVKRWIRSCETQEQLNLCKEAVGVFIVKRDGEEVSMIDETFAKAEIGHELEEMEKNVTQ